MLILQYIKVSHIMNTANAFCSSWALISVVLVNHYTTENYPC